MYYKSPSKVLHCIIILCLYENLIESNTLIGQFTCVLCVLCTFKPLDGMSSKVLVVVLVVCMGMLYLVRMTTSNLSCPSLPLPYRVGVSRACRTTNYTVSCISGMSQVGAHSVIGGNIRFFTRKV